MIKKSKHREIVVDGWERPQNATELCMFIGCVNYYRDMWPSRAHVLKPPTDMSGLKKKAKIDWTPAMQNAFNKMRSLLAADALSAYPDHNKRFDLYSLMLLTLR